MRPYTIVIIGAGFSGAMTAVQLMRQTRTPLRIVLVNKSGRVARGLAYGTRSPGHLLNVPAGNMSALPEAPNDFLDYCRWADPCVAPHSFVPRALYGAYLEALLSSTESGLGASRHATLERLTGEVLALSRGGASHPDRTLLTLDDGNQLECDTVVLAFGHFPPATVSPCADIDALGHHYIADPWADERLHDVHRGASVLLVGNSLTALDVLTSLNQLGHTGPIVCVSRRGLVQQSHRPEGAPASGSKPDGAALASNMGSTLRGQTRVLRAAIAAAIEERHDWRDVIGSLRAHTPALWQALGQSDKRRFLRHVRPYWDVLRHRCAPEAAELVHELKQAGRLDTLAARIRSARISSDDGRAEVTFRLRGSGEMETRRFDLVINCTGPSSDLMQSNMPLLKQLLQQGHLQADPLGLGLRVDAHYATLDAADCAQSWLRYIGPMLKARDWEAIAVPELRVHAQKLAAVLLAARDAARDAAQDATQSASAAIPA